MAQIPPFRTRSLNRRYTGLRRFLRSLRGRLVNSHRVHLVEVRGYRCKQVTFHDSWLAEKSAATLGALRGSKLCPELIAHFEKRLFVEYIEGEPLVRFNESDAPRLVEFFATLYRGRGTLRDSDSLPIAASLATDLQFLHDVGVIDGDCARDLRARLARGVPRTLQVGFDYTDPLPRNFVRRENGDLVAVDVESLESDVVQGTGLAKVLSRSDEAFRHALLEHLRDAGHHALADTLPFVELAFLSEWTKYAFLKGRSKLVDPSRFDAFRA